MANIFYLPDLGEGLAEADIHEWHVKTGDHIQKDQLMVSVETAKSLVDIPAPFSGEVKKLFGNPGDKIKTGAPLIEIASEENVATVAGKLETSNVVLPPEKISASKPATTAVKALPAARALAQKLGVNLQTLRGSGPNGEITVKDVEDAHTPQAPWLTQAETISGVRRHMAENMQRAHREVVPAQIFLEVDIHAWPEKTDVSARLVRALCQACQQEPALNAWYDGNQQKRLVHSAVHLGLAMDTPHGLFVPVVKDADKKSAIELRQIIDGYKQQLADKTLGSEHFSGATITLSNIGNFAGRFATPIVLPPTVAIIAVGRSYDVVVLTAGQPVAHRCLPVSLTFDHRAVTGGEAARFLSSLQKDLSLQ